MLTIDEFIKDKDYRRIEIFAEFEKGHYTFAGVGRSEGGKFYATDGDMYETDKVIDKYVYDEKLDTLFVYVQPENF